MSNRLFLAMEEIPDNLGSIVRGKFTVTWLFLGGADPEFPSLGRSSATSNIAQLRRVTETLVYEGAEQRTTVLRVVQAHRRESSAELFSRVATALYGEQFDVPMATALKIEKSAIGKFVGRKATIPPVVWFALINIIDSRERLLAELPALRLAAQELANPPEADTDIDFGTPSDPHCPA